MTWWERFLDWLLRRYPPSEAQHIEVRYEMNIKLVVQGGFPGTDKAPTPNPEVITAVKVYRMPGRVLMTGGSTVFAPTPPHTPGTQVQFTTTFDPVDFPAGANQIVVAFVDDDGTENAGVTASFNVTDAGPSEATGVTVTATVK